MQWITDLMGWIQPVSLVIASASAMGAILMVVLILVGPSHELESQLPLVGACLKMMALFLIVAGVWS